MLLKHCLLKKRWCFFRYIKKRKQELSDTYDERLDDNRTRRKKVENKRGKKKNQQMSCMRRYTRRQVLKVDSDISTTR